ncbi:ychA ta domain protein [Escherichia coli STEC_O31]|nr:ychA ta domain protein [Escherichia coli STEC_O31]
MLSPPALRAAIQGERLIMNENSTLNALILSSRPQPAAGAGLAGRDGC